MSYNREYGIISGNVSTDDVSQAIGVNSGDIYTLCTSDNINPMAKFKPVRSTKKTALTDNERQLARWGMNINIPNFAANNSNPDNTWGYLQPRLGTDWARETDFANYFAYACTPFAFNVNGALKDGVGIQVYIDSMAGTYYQDTEGSGFHWDEQRNLSIQNLFGGVVLGGNAWEDAYFGVLIFDIDHGDSVAIVFNKKFSTLSSTVPNFVLYGEQKTESGINYPAVSMLNDSLRSGNTFRFIACLFMNGPDNPTTNAYQEKPNNMTVYSLALTKGIDRKDVVLYDSQSIMGLKCHLANQTITATYQGQVTKYGNTLDDYLISGDVIGTLTTPYGHWGAVDSVVSEIIITNYYGYCGDAQSRDATVSKAISIPNNNTTYTKTVAEIRNLHVYFYPQVDSSSRTVKISGYVRRLSEKVWFDNTLEAVLVTS